MIKRILKIFFIVFLFTICSVFVFAQSRQFWTSMVINNGVYSGSLGFFAPKLAVSTLNSEPKMILTDNGLKINGDFQLKNNFSSTGKILLSIDSNGNANWVDSLCPAGYALRGFDNNGRKECTELPFGIYSYPKYLRDSLQRDSQIHISFHSGHFFSKIIFSTDENSYSGGGWRDVKRNVSSTRDNPDADYCVIVGPAGMIGISSSPWADGIITSSRQLICRGMFTARGKIDLTEKGWTEFYNCESDLCLNNALGDNRHKIRRWGKFFYGCNVNTMRNIKNEPCTP